MAAGLGARALGMTMWYVARLGGKVAMLACMAVPAGLATSRAMARPGTSLQSFERTQTSHYCNLPNFTVQ